MSAMLWLITACTFGAVTLLIIGLTMKSEREIVQDRIQAQSDITGGMPVGSIEAEMTAPFKDRIVLPFLRKLAGIAGGLTPAGAIEAANEKLETAGRPWGLGGQEFIGIRIVSAAVLTVAAVLLAGFVGVPFPLNILLLILLVFIGFILPDAMLQHVINERQASIRRVLADTLDLLTVSVEAGLGLDGAMERVVDKFKNPLSQEMRRALQEMQVGKLRAVALKDMAHRVKLTELSTFVAAICQAEQLGVSIAKVLRVQGDTLRVQRSQRARETAARLPVKMLFPLVFCIFPAIFVVLLAPAIIRILRAL